MIIKEIEVTFVESTFNKNIAPHLHKKNVNFVCCHAVLLKGQFLQLCMGLSSATIFFPLAAPLECNVLQCQKLLGFGVVFTFSTFYMIVVALYIVMLWRINKRRYSSQNEVSFMSYHCFKILLPRNCLEMNHSFLI